MYTSRTGSPLMLFAEPRSPLFWPSKAYMNSACRSFRPPPQAPMPGVSTSGGATPMPDHISSSTHAWDPLSRTPTRYSHSYFSWPKPTNKIYRTIDPSSLTQRHPLLDEQLVGSSLKVMVKLARTEKSSFWLPRLMGLSVYDIMSIIP